MRVVDLGHISFTYYYNGDIKGCRKHLEIHCDDDNLQPERFLKLLKNKYSCKFLMDKRYVSDRSTLNCDDLNFWYDTERSCEAIALEGKNLISYVEGIEDIINNRKSEEFSKEATWAVYVTEPSCYDKQLQFSCMSGIFNGHTAFIEVTNKYTNELDKPLSYTLADILHDTYICDYGEIVTRDDIFKIKKRGFVQPLNEYNAHFGVIVKGDNGKRLQMSKAKILSLQNPVNSDIICDTLKELWPYELEDKNVRIYWF